jgi:uncharacterized membrane protein
MKQDQIIRAALMGLFALGTTSATLSQAAEAQEACYGVAKAGQNDCANSKAGHSCAGLSKKDNDPNEYKMVKAGTCASMGGKTQAPSTKS